MGLDFKRSILFFPNSAEEKGLLGSYYYVENPIFPLDKTIACLNVDMIGRMDKFHQNDSNYVYLIGSDKLSTDLHNISEYSNKKYIDSLSDYLVKSLEFSTILIDNTEEYTALKNSGLIELIENEEVVTMLQNKYSNHKFIKEI